MCLRPLPCDIPLYPAFCLVGRAGEDDVVCVFARSPSTFPFTLRSPLARCFAPLTAQTLSNSCLQCPTLGVCLPCTGHGAGRSGAAARRQHSRGVPAAQPQRRAACPAWTGRDDRRHVWKKRASAPNPAPRALVRYCLCTLAIARAGGWRWTTTACARMRRPCGVHVPSLRSRGRRCRSHWTAQSAAVTRTPPKWPPSLASKTPCSHSNGTLYAPRSPPHPTPSGTPEPCRTGPKLKRRGMTARAHVCSSGGRDRARH